MMRVMMEEGYYDAPFLKRHTNMPFLLYRDDAGEWQPLVDDEGRPQVVMEGTRELRTLKKFSNDNRTDIEGRTFCPDLKAPEGLQVDGKAVQTVFQAQLEELHEYTPGVGRCLHRHQSRDHRAYRPGVRHQPTRHHRSWLARCPLWQHHDAASGAGDDSGPDRWHRHHRRLDPGRRVSPQGQGDVQGATMRGHEIAAPMANLAGMHFAKMVIGAVSKGENFSHGQARLDLGLGRATEGGGVSRASRLPVMTDTGFRESIEGKVNFNG